MSNHQDNQNHQNSAAAQNSTEAYPLKDINPKTTDETTPLTGNDNPPPPQSGLEEKLSSLEKENNETGNNQQSKKRRSILTIRTAEELLQNRNSRIIIAGIGLILLLLSILVIVIILIVNSDNDDQTYRFLKIIPKPRGSNNLIYYRHGDLKRKESRTRSWQDMVQEIETFLAPYRRRPPNTTMCFINEPLPDGHVCLFDLNTIDRECLKSDYGYMSGSPCIFIVFNNITDWIPESSNQTDSTNIVDVECIPNNQFDAENIGPMVFTPFQGFSTIYFPYRGQENYMSPFVVLRLLKPTQNVGIGITCRLLASNLPSPPEINHYDSNIYNTQEPVPYIPFNIFIE